MRRGLCLLIGVWVAAALVATQTRVHLWGLGERAVWADAVGHAPEKPRPWLNLGRQYALDGNDALAADAYRRALVLAQRPGRTVDEQVFARGLATANLAMLRCEAGDLGGALALTAGAMQSTDHPRARALQQVHLWLTQQRTRGGCTSAPSLF